MCQSQTTVSEAESKRHMAPRPDLTKFYDMTDVPRIELDSQIGFR